jgi:hypothetical protein
MAWRRAKVAELRSVQMFDQEYPASPEMAFASADAKRSFILPISVLRARKRKDIKGAGPLIIGADPSGPGKDRFAVAARQGPKVLWVQHRQMPETQDAVLWLASIIEEHRPNRMFIDLGNIGHAVFSLLRAMRDSKTNRPLYTDILRGVNFGGNSEAKLARPKTPGPKNRRAEMWDRSREWLELDSGVSIPDMDMLQADATAPRVKPLITNDFLIESKEEMRKRGIRSPDLWDAVILTFAEMERIIGAETRAATDRSDARGDIVIQHSTPSRSNLSLPTPMGGDAWMGV